MTHCVYVDDKSNFHPNFINFFWLVLIFIPYSSKVDSSQFIVSLRSNGNYQENKNILKSLLARTYFRALLVDGKE